MGDGAGESGGGLSAEQKTRISERFRAAKALLARKRPRYAAAATPCSTTPLFHSTEGDSGSVKKPPFLGTRVPLAEITVNGLSAFPLNHSVTDKGVSCVGDAFKPNGHSRKFETFPSPRNLKYVSESSLVNGLGGAKVVSVKIEGTSSVRDIGTRKCESVCESSIINSAYVQTDNGYASDSFNTPAKQCHSTSFRSCDKFGSGFFDDDLDESVLKEIDALCEQKQGPTTLRRNIIEENVGCMKAEVQCIESETSVEREGDETQTCELPDILKEMERRGMPKESLDYLMSLNDRQQEAACSDIEIPLMILAGPGSGKTSTMVGRIVVLLNEGINPSHILGMTFTIAAASEMRDRIGKVAGKAIAKELRISTFHSFCLPLCQSHAEKLGRTSEFVLFGHGQQRRAIIEAVRLWEIEKSKDSSEDVLGDPQLFKDKSKKWQKFVTQAKSSGMAKSHHMLMNDVVGGSILGKYDEILRSCNALDYHDLISCSVKLLTEFPEVYKECQELWKAIIIDEFQDTSSMQYNLLRILASHNCITIVGDDDQSIFSFNGADVSGFNSFRADFPTHKEIRLNKNYRSTRYIVEAASYLIRNNSKRCQSQNALTDNCSGSKIFVNQCYNESAQCAFVVDKIVKITSSGSTMNCPHGNIAILYRRQVSGKAFQLAFRERRIPFNTHGVAFYRKKVVKSILAMLKSISPSCDDGSYSQVFKALLPFKKDEKKKVVQHIKKISTIRKYSFLSAACDIFGAKVSGTLKRNQLAQGRKVLSTLDMISKLAHRELSISAVITSVANMIPQKYLLDQRAVLDADGGKLLNEDNDIRSVLQYLLDDVSDFLSSRCVDTEGESKVKETDTGCVKLLTEFVDYVTVRERENFRFRSSENKDSVTLTTIHQSKGLEWDVVFIVKANESEIPLMHEFGGAIKENGALVEEERRLFYVAMTRARKKLFILYVTMDSNWQLLPVSRFVKEIPCHLFETQAGFTTEGPKKEPPMNSKETDVPIKEETFKVNIVKEIDMGSEGPNEAMNAWTGNVFLKRFDTEDRAMISHLFHQWAKKQAFKEPRRLLDKVGFVIDERLTVQKNKNKDLLRALKSFLKSQEAMIYAESVLQWEQIPADERAHLRREKEEHFQKLRIEKSMGSSAATPKQIAFLQSLGCTVVPTSRLHASNLIEQYKSL